MPVIAAQDIINIIIVIIIRLLFIWFDTYSQIHSYTTLILWHFLLIVWVFERIGIITIIVYIYINRVRLILWVMDSRKPRTWPELIPRIRSRTPPHRRSIWRDRPIAVLFLSKKCVYLSVWYYYIYQFKCIIPANCFISPFYFRAAVSECLYARLSCVRCQAVAAYLMFFRQIKWWWDISATTAVRWRLFTALLQPLRTIKAI